MKTIQAIKIAVDNEFQTQYARNMVKAYLIKWKVRDGRKQYSNRQIGFILGIDRQKVADYLFQVQQWIDNGNNALLSQGFSEKYNNVLKAIEATATDNALNTYLSILEGSTERTKITLNNVKKYYL